MPTPKILLHYTDGSLAQIGDRVEFKQHFGYGCHRCYTGEGTLQSVSLGGIVYIDISPESFQEDCGRFGTRNSHLFPLFAQYDWQRGTETLKDGSPAVHYNLTNNKEDWSLDYPKLTKNFIQKKIS